MGWFSGYCAKLSFPLANNSDSLTVSIMFGFVLIQRLALECQTVRPFLDPLVGDPAEFQKCMHIENAENNMPILPRALTSMRATVGYQNDIPQTADRIRKK